ncbi:unnamed protein product [Linum trigynum]|uniref:MULE transposase domain-containing protein n=1 Tax=Linum trigynum TaxID=586398 RepID=A0AAV2ERK1_9ROSI
MPLVTFTGINHHFKTCLFGSALLPNETDETYIWALKIVKEIRCSKNPKFLHTLPEPSTLGDDSSFNIRYGSLQFMAQRFCLLGADTPLFYRIAQDELTAACNKLEMVKKTPAERERIVIPDKFKDVLNPNQVRFKGCRKGKGKKPLKKKRRKCGNCGLRDGHYRSTCTNPPADVVESQSDEEDYDDDMDDDGDDDGDDGEDGDDDDGDDDQGGQPQKKQQTSRHNTTGEPIGKSQPQQKIGARTRRNTSQQEKGAEKGAKKHTGHSAGSTSRHDDRPGDEHELVLFQSH